MLDAVEAPARVAAAVAHLIRIVLKLFCLEAICLNIISTLNAIDRGGGKGGHFVDFDLVI